MGLVRIDLKSSVFIQGEPKDYVRTNFPEVKNMTAYDSTVKVELSNNEAIFIPDSNIAGKRVRSE